jgi:Sulfatase
MSKLKEATISALKATSACTVVCLPLIAMALWMKADVVSQSQAGAPLTAFGADILAAFCCLWVLCALALGLPSRWRPIGIASVCSLLILFLYIQDRCLTTVGMFQSSHALRQAVFWAASNRDVAGHYLGFTVGHVIVGLLIAATWALAVWVRRFGPSLRLAAVPASGILLGAILTALCVPRERSVAFWQAGSSFLATDSVVQSELPSYQEALSEYRAIVGSDAQKKPTQKKPTAYHALAKDCDVIWFLLETAPARCLPADDPLNDFPNLRRLAQHSLVAQRHYTTFPATLQSIASLLLSWYPPPLMMLETCARRSKPLPGIGTILARNGYHTAVYLADPEFESTQGWLKAAGIKRIWNFHAMSTKQIMSFQDRIERDLVTLKAMLADLSSWTQSKQRYFLIFDPQIGHGLPWDFTKQLKTPDDMFEARRQAIRLQDEWLGQVLAILERNGRLEHTIILVSGDHGVRSTLEDPGLRTGLLDDRSFHVPCYLYVPQIKSAQIDYVTSHIDIGPSILDLLGLERDVSEQGCPLWEEQVRHRVTLLCGASYLGVDGFYQNGQFNSVNALSNQVMQSNRCHYDDFRPMSNDSGAAQVRATIDRLRQLTQVWPVLDWPTRQFASTDPAQ